MLIQPTGLLVSTRVRCCLWKLGLPKSEWQSWLDLRLCGHVYLNTDLVRGRLQDDQIEEEYLNLLAGLFNLEPEDLRFGDPFGGSVSPLVENLKHLIKGEGVGGKGRLADELRLNRTTISRWLSGDSQPTVPTQARLMAHFRLPKGTDLERDPIFLALGPVALQEKQAWVQERLEALDPETFSALFPALQRLLSQP